MSSKILDRNRGPTSQTLLSLVSIGAAPNEEKRGWKMEAEGMVLRTQEGSGDNNGGYN